MTRLPLAGLLLVPLLACEPGTVEDDTRVPAAPPAPAQVSEADTAGAVATVHAFHRALAEADSAAALELLHPDALIYEAGHAETVEEYRAGHLAADIRFAAATERRLLDERTVVLDGVVLHLSETHTTGRVGEREIDSQGVGTMVLARDAGVWRIRHIHWSSR